MFARLQEAQIQLGRTGQTRQRQRKRQQALLAGALEGALAHIPLLLRGPVRKILLP